MADITISQLPDLTPTDNTQVPVTNGITTGKATISQINALGTPPGTVITYAGNTAPTGYLACDGLAVNRTTYSALFAAIGTIYGTGDGSTTFNLPDLRGYFVRGSGTNSNGTASGTFGAKQTANAGSFTFAVTQDDGDGNTGSYRSLTNVILNGVNRGYNAGTAATTVNVTPGDTRPANIAMLYCIKI